MSAQEALGPQFIEHADLGKLRAGDFPGQVGGKNAMRNFDEYSRDGGLRGTHREHGGPAQYLEHLKGQIQADGGVQEPITVAHFDIGGRKSSRIWDGHHRALAAHQLGMGVPARHVPVEKLT